MWQPTRILAGFILCAGFAAGPCATPASAAPVTGQDDLGNTVTLASPAKRIVSLAPHTTELLFAIGAGHEVVGVSQFSDYPEAAKHLPSVGGANGFDLERVAALKPDLVVLWASGTSATQVATLQKLGIAIFESEPHDLATVASSLERLATLSGTAQAGKQAADAFRARWQALATRHAKDAPVSVFYQIWGEPLMTLNDHHLASAAIALCGGRNVFGKLGPLAPTVNLEAVLQADPEVIITGSDAGTEALAPWKKFPQITAVRRDNLFALDSGTLTRGSPRVLDGAEALCDKLETARARRK